MSTGEQAILSATFEAELREWWARSDAVPVHVLAFQGARDVPKLLDALAALRSELGEAQRERDLRTAERDAAEGRWREMQEHWQREHDELGEAQRERDRHAAKVADLYGLLNGRTVAACFNAVKCQGCWDDMVARAEAAERALGEAQDTINRQAEVLRHVLDIYENVRNYAKGDLGRVLEAARALLSEGETP